MNGAATRNPMAETAGRTASQVCGVSGKPCSRSTSGPEPSSKVANRSPLAWMKDGCIRSALPLRRRRLVSSWWSDRLGYRGDSLAPFLLHHPVSRALDDHHRRIGRDDLHLLSERRAVGFLAADRGHGHRKPGLAELGELACGLEKRGEVRE